MNSVNRSIHAATVRWWQADCDTLADYKKCLEAAKNDDAVNNADAFSATVCGDLGINAAKALGATATLADCPWSDLKICEDYSEKCADGQYTLGSVQCGAGDHKRERYGNGLNWWNGMFWNGVNSGGCACFESGVEFFGSKAPAKTYGITPDAGVVLLPTKEFPYSSVSPMAPLLVQQRAPEAPCEGFGSAFNTMLQTNSFQATPPGIPNAASGRKDAARG